MDGAYAFDLAVKTLEKVEKALAEGEPVEEIREEIQEVLREVK